MHPDDGQPLLPRRDGADEPKLLPDHAESLEGIGTRHPPHHPAHRARYTAYWLAAALAVTGMYAAGMAVHDRLQERDYARALGRRLTGGDPARAPALMRAYGCAGCHTIPGVPGAGGLVGPSLAGIGSRIYIGGVATNTPDNLVQWITNPKAIDAKTAMPVTGVTDEQARHIAAYLYTLR